MSMTIIIAALIVAMITYIGIGIVTGKHTENIRDWLPYGGGNASQVFSSGEFSASTVATTISLATVVIAFFELAPYLGIWLFWTVITTSLGLFAVRLVAQNIWNKISSYEKHPTLHEFLGTEYNSKLLSFIAAIATSLGFIGAFAVELTVGSRFIAQVAPQIPSWIVLIIISSIVFTYTSMGGFRAVIVTDRFQMISIWLLLFAIPVFYIFFTVQHGGFSQAIASIPNHLLHLTWQEGTLSFLLGIFVINVPTFISDMSIWQRISGSRDSETIMGGLWKSIFSSAITWGCLVFLAIFSLSIVGGNNETNPLFNLILYIGNDRGIFNSIILFFIVLGLYGAMLSTASTQLIAVSHTIYEDVFSQIRKIPLNIRMDSKREIWISRFILITTAFFAVLLVEILSYVGFSIADLVFAVYGAQLGLFPPIIYSLYSNKAKGKNLSYWATMSIICGFITGWGSAVIGKVINNGNLVFLAPVFSLGISSLMLSIGLIIERKND